MVIFMTNFKINFQKSKIPTNSNVYGDFIRGDNQIRTGDEGVADPRQTPL